MAAAGSAPLAVEAPQNLDAEDTVLGALLLAGTQDSAAVVERVREAGLQPFHFYRQSNGRLYAQIVRQAEQGAPFDPLTIAADPPLDVDPERIHELASLVPAIGLAPHHARLIIDAHQRYRAFTLAQKLEKAALNGGVPDELLVEISELGLLAAEPLEKPKVVTLTTFASETDPETVPAIGKIGEALLPVGGLLIMGGEGGASKTTLTLDAVAHIASGTAWLGYDVPRPLRVLLIENEGARSQFRLKISDKIAAWPGRPFTDNVYVWTDPWASFNFTNDSHRRALRDLVDERHIDLVVADPLDSLGIEGAGKPEETRDFIRRLKECGLHDPYRPLAFWLLHHFNKVGHKSVVQQLSGAWGGHPDTVLGIEMGDSQTTKLTWGKLRWATPPKEKTTILHWETETRGFSAVEKQAFDIDDLRTRVLEHVRQNPGQATSKIEDAVEGGRKYIRQALEWLTTDEGGRQVATGPGERKNGKYWYPHNQAVLDLATDPGAGSGERGEHREYADRPREVATAPVAGTGEVARTPFAAVESSLDEVLATTPPLRSRGEVSGGENEDGPDHPAHHLATPRGGHDPEDPGPTEPNLEDDTW